MTMGGGGVRTRPEDHMSVCQAPQHPVQLQFELRYELKLISIWSFNTSILQSAYIMFPFCNDEPHVPLSFTPLLRNVRENNKQNTMWANKTCFHNCTAVNNGPRLIMNKA